MLTLHHNWLPLSHARHDCYHHFNVTKLMADAFGLFQLLSSGTSIFVYSDTLKDNSAGYKPSATVNLPNDIGAVVGLFHVEIHPPCRLHPMSLKPIIALILYIYRTTSRICLILKSMSS